MFLKNIFAYILIIKQVYLIEEGWTYEWCFKIIEKTKYIPKTNHTKYKNQNDLCCCDEERMMIFVFEKGISNFVAY